jgi:hypothetical protein
MLSNKLKLVEVLTDEEFVNTSYDCNELVQLTGDSIWDCTLSEVRILGICVCEGVAGGDYDGYLHIAVTHDGGEESWRLYTDSGFKQAVRDLLGDDSISYTEQGMQDDGYASME